MPGVMNREDCVEVFWDFFEGTIYPTISCQSICDQGRIKGTFSWKGKNMVATGGSPGKKGWLEAYEVIPLATYKGDREPLEYQAHWDRNEERRGYTGMLVKHGKEKVVLGERVTFVPLPETEQIALFG